MKKTVLTTLGLAIGFSSFAQLPVSTTAENKNVILEEYTGIYCGWCPTGHASAQVFKDNNPDDVFLINVHAGGYATPQNSSDLDFRTPEGTGLANAFSISAFPAAMMNRRSAVNLQSGNPPAFPSGDLDDLLTEASYANIAFDANINAVTRELTVDVEVYFTGNGPASSNINIALLQNDIAGGQSGTNGNPSQVLPNGDYNHTHALRSLITGQWGDPVTTTTQGTTVTRQYTYTIPAMIENIPMELNNLEVIAFIAEGQNEIITGTDGPLTINIPNGVDEVDLAAGSNMNYPADYCDNAVTPEITVNNAGSSDIDTLEVSYSLNGGTAVTAMVYQTVAAGQSYTHTFPAITAPTGENEIVYNVNTSADLTSIELTNGNNESASNKWYTLPATAFATTHSEGFESNALSDVAPPNSIADNPDGLSVFVVNQNAASSVNWELGGYENSTNSYLWNFYGIQSGSASLVWEKIDFSTNANYSLIFSHAYAQYNNEDDQLEIFVSTDCGNTWTSVWSEAGSTLSTAPALNSGNFFPKSDEWTTTNVDLSAYDGESEVMIKMEGTSDYGNNLYVDDIMITWPTDIVENETPELKVFPNPAFGLFNVSFELTNSSEGALELYDASGKLVKRIDNLITGQNNIIFDSGSLDTGIYTITFVDGNRKTSKKLSVLK